jgi:hypothetical protein
LYHSAAIIIPAKPSIAMFVTAGALFPDVDDEGASVAALGVSLLPPAPVVVAVVLLAVHVPVPAVAQALVPVIAAVYVSLLADSAATQISFDAL